MPKYEKLKEYHNLYEYVSSKYIKGKHNFVLIDEVQMCQEFEKIINGIHAEEKYDIYITGSNAFLLSSDLATLFTGRTFEIEIYPFSFKEYLQYYKYKDIQEAFDNYTKEGGMSGSYVYKTQEDKYKYIEDVFNTLILRDIKQKYNIRNVDILNNLTNFLNSNKIEITDKTIKNYIDYLCNSFAFYKVKRYDIKGKKYLSTQDKYYLADHSIKYATLGTTNMDYGRTYENIVAIELLRRGYELYVGTLYKKEVDFIAKKRNENIYIQVSDNIDYEETLKREAEPLLQIRDAYPKVIIARTRHEDYQYEGIQIYDIAKWLMK